MQIYFNYFNKLVYPNFYFFCYIVGKMIKKLGNPIFQNTP